MNNIPQIIDLFSGCGGLGLGLHEAGFPVCGGADIDESAVMTASFNLQNYKNKSGYSIIDLSESEISDFIKHKGKFIAAGGPPCQAYSRVGRGKLRSLGEDRYYLNDPRGNLYKDFLRLVLEADAEAVVMENVPESVNFGGVNIPETVCCELENKGYYAVWSILNSADYGVPQIRERVFVLAVKKKYTNELSFPEPTHKKRPEDKEPWFYWKNNLRVNKHFRLVENDNCSNYWVTVSEAISDLPSLFSSEKSKYILHRPNILIHYKSKSKNNFQRIMRSGDDSEEHVSGNSFRKTLRDFPLFAKMKPGDNFLKVKDIAVEMFEEACRNSGISRAAYPDRYDKLYKKMVPPYSVEKFHDKWKKLDPDKPSPTVTAHLSIDTYSHIHPWEPRGISVREAARLQSFPDSFIFTCGMGEAFKQIGNAVPPLLSRRIGEYIISIIS